MSDSTTWGEIIAAAAGVLLAFSAGWALGFRRSQQICADVMRPLNARLRHLRDKLDRMAHMEKGGRL